MSIEKFLKSKLNEVAVYWGNPTPQADGTLGYDPPVEIACFWDDTQTFLTHQNEGRAIEEVVYRAQIHVGQDLDEKGYIYRGTLNDLSTEEVNDPLIVPRAYPIKRLLKYPSLVVKGAFVRIAMTWYG